MSSGVKLPIRKTTMETYEGNKGRKSVGRGQEGMRAWN